jgi:hypothetical protein
MTSTHHGNFELVGFAEENRFGNIFGGCRKYNQSLVAFSECSVKT